MVTTNVNFRAPQIDSGAAAIDVRVRAIGTLLFEKAGAARNSTAMQAGIRLIFTFLALYILQYISIVEETIATQMPPFRWINHILIIILTCIVLLICITLLFELVCFLSGIPFRLCENAIESFKKIDFALPSKILSPTANVPEVEPAVEEAEPVHAPVLDVSEEESSSELDTKFSNSPLDPLSKNSSQMSF